MSPKHKAYHRILAIAPCSTGFGYALLEGEALVEWGVRSVKGDKNSGSVAKVEELMFRYEPEVVVLEDTGAEGSRRSPRIRELSQRIFAMSLARKVPVAWFRREQIMRFCFGNGKGTKQEMAQIVAKSFPDELGTRVPPARRTWKSQDYRIDMFDAVALALMLRLHGTSSIASAEDSR